MPVKHALFGFKITSYHHYGNYKIGLRDCQVHINFVRSGMADGCLEKLVLTYNSG